MFLVIGWDGWHDSVSEIETEEELKKEIENGSFGEDAQIYKAELYGVVKEKSRTYTLVKEV